MAKNLRLASPAGCEMYPKWPWKVEISRIWRQNLSIFVRGRATHPDESSGASSGCRRSYSHVHSRRNRSGTSSSSAPGWFEKKSIEIRIFLFDSSVTHQSMVIRTKANQSGNFKSEKIRCCGPIHSSPPNCESIPLGGSRQGSEVPGTGHRMDRIGLQQQQQFIHPVSRDKRTSLHRTELSF